MSDIKHREHLEREISPVDKWKHFQDNYGKKAGIGISLILIFPRASPNSGDAGTSHFRAGSAVIFIFLSAETG